MGGEPEEVTFPALSHLLCGKCFKFCAALQIDVAPSNFSRKLIPNMNENIQNEVKCEWGEPILTLKLEPGGCLVGKLINQSTFWKKSCTVFSSNRLKHAEPAVWSFKGNLGLFVFPKRLSRVWGMVSADLDAFVFFNHDIPRAVLGTKTDNKRVMKRSRSNIVFMCNRLWGQKGNNQEGNLLQIP